MLTIRLSRKGQRNRPMYRLIISENAKDPYDKPLEFLGSYNPYSKELDAKEERIRYWLGQGAGMSPSVNNLLISKNIIDGKKVKASKGGQPEQTATQETAGGEEAATESQETEGETQETAEEASPAEAESAETGQEAPAQEGSEEPTEEQPQDSGETENSEEENQ